MSSTEKLIHDTISSALAAIGIGIVCIRILGRGDGVSSHSTKKVLEILIEREDGGRIAITDCKQVSRTVSTILDVEELIDESYNIEVSSAGIERPLVKHADFVKFIGHVAQIKLHNAVEESKKFIGAISEVTDDTVTIKLQNTGKDMHLLFENIKDAKLVLTDELFRKLLNNKITE